MSAGARSGVRQAHGSLELLAIEGPDAEVTEIEGGVAKAKAERVGSLNPVAVELALTPPPVVDDARSAPIDAGQVRRASWDDERKPASLANTGLSVRYRSAHHRNVEETLLPSPIRLRMRREQHSHSAIHASVAARSTWGQRLALTLGLGRGILGAVGFAAPVSFASQSGLPGAEQTTPYSNYITRHNGVREMLIGAMIVMRPTRLSGLTLGIAADILDVAVGQLTTRDRASQDRARALTSSAAVMAALGAVAAFHSLGEGPGNRFAPSSTKDRD